MISDGFSDAEHVIIAVYIDSLVMISIEKSETNKKKALEI